MDSREAIEVLEEENKVQFNNKYTRLERMEATALAIKALEIVSRLDEERIQDAIMKGHRSHAGYFTTNKILDDVTLAKVIIEELNGSCFYAHSKPIK